ncbi:TPA: hypothetical protein NV714_005863 [Escherichia coli]|nr:hypothetical protein [Escherichia coli]
MFIKNNEIFQGNRKNAKELGYKFYSTGKFCKNNNIEIRNLRAECVCPICFQQEKQRKIKWKDANPIKYQKSKEKYRVEKKDNVKASHFKHNSKRRVKFKKSVIYSELDQLVILEAYKLSKIREKETGIKWHIDHMIPLNAKKVNGLHCAENIQVIPAFLNLKKNNSLMYINRYDFLKDC